MAVSPILAAVQNVVHLEKWPESFKDPGNPPCREQMDAYFKPPTKVLEAHFGATPGKFAPGRVAREIENYQAILVKRLSSARPQYVADETDRRRAAAEKATAAARRSSRGRGMVRSTKRRLGSMDTR